MFNYFLPGVKKETVAPGDKLDHAVLATLGLGEVLADLRDVPSDAQVVYANVGPASGGGTFIVPTRKYSGVPQVRYDASLQNWKAANGGKFWLGWMAKDRPEVRDLERKELVAGEEIEDEQGNVWKVPIARAPHWNHTYGTLPQSYTFDDCGNPVPQLMPRFQWLWDLSGEIQQWYSSNADAIIAAQAEQQADSPPPAPKTKAPFTRLVQYAARILAVNYRVSFVELNALHSAGLAVLTNDTVHSICQATYGWVLEEEVKKKSPTPDSADRPNSMPSTTGDGTPVVAPGTVPAAEASSPPASSIV